MIKFGITAGKAPPVLMPELAPAAAQVPAPGIAQTVRPDAIPAPYPETNAKPCFAAYHGFNDKSVPVLRRVF